MKTNLKLLLSAALVAGLMSAGTFATSCGSGGTGGSGGGSTGGGTGGGSTGGGTGGGTAGGSGGGTAGGSGGGTAGGSGGGTAGGSGGGTAGGSGGGTAGGTGGAGGGTAGGAGGGTAGGAGGGGGAGGAGGGSAAATCQQYCNSVVQCDAGTSLSQYPSIDSCLGTCMAFQQGTIGMTGGNNLECRTYHAGVAASSVANKGLHCPHAGPAGDGVCGGNCESFCAIAASKCPNSFADAGVTCATACAAYTGSGGHYNSQSASGNTFDCHMYHLTVAATNATLNAQHCGHIVPGPGPCN